MIISGHVPLDTNGNVRGPYGKVGGEVSLAEAVWSARWCALAMLSSVEAAIGSLDQIADWTVVKGYVNNAASFNDFPKVMNGCSDLLLTLFGAEAGAHARVALGVSGLPFDVPVEVEAELVLR